MLLVLQAEIVSVFGILSSNNTVHKYQRLLLKAFATKYDKSLFLMCPAINVLRLILGINNFLAAVQPIIS